MTRTELSFSFKNKTYPEPEPVIGVDMAKDQDETVYYPRRCLCCGAPEGQVAHD